MSQRSSGQTGPVFLAGVDRSGIGLLGEVLECHPDLSMTRRTNFWAFYADRLGALTSPAAVDRCIDEMMRNARMRVLRPDRDRLHADFARGAPTYARLFEQLQLQLMQRRGCSRWGDKSLGAERFAESIFSAYPTASMVHVLRDPRDRHAAHANHRELRRRDAGRGAALWHWSERLARKHSRRFPGRYLVVRFEDLILEPELALEGVREFLGLARPVGAMEASPLWTTSIGRHRQDLTPQERRYLQLVLARGMRRRGYAPDSLDLTAREEVSFWTRTLPVDSAKAAAWIAANALRRERGRNPSDRRLEPISEETVTPCE